MGKSGRKWEIKMFFGFYEHTLDDKGRLVIPRKMREEAGVKVYILKGYDGALSIYKQSTFEKLVEEINSLPYNKKESRAFLRIQLSSVCDLDVDKAGRVQIPTQLLSKYNIGKQVVVIGAGDHIEVWDQATYAKYEAEAEANFEDIAQNIGKED
jgi:MraZ protein